MDKYFGIIKIYIQFTYWNNIIKIKNIIDIKYNNKNEKKMIHLSYIFHNIKINIYY